MSLRQQAKILGISPTYLSLMVNGKRKWQPEIKARYEQLVNSLPKSVYKKHKTVEGVVGGDSRLLVVEVNSGGAEEARTPDPLLAKQVLSQLSYSPLAVVRNFH